MRIISAAVLLAAYWFAYKSLTLADVTSVTSINPVIVLVFTLLLGSVMYFSYRITFFYVFMWLHDLTQKMTPRTFIKDRYSNLKKLGSYESTVEAIRIYRNTVCGQTWHANLVIIASVVHLLYQSCLVGVGFSVMATLNAQWASAITFAVCAAASWVLGYFMNSHVEKDELFELRGMLKPLDEAAVRLGYRVPEVTQIATDDG